ncbi:hypothetical protein, partial [Proteus mirabilis]|uniref:hypothetical protein n=1 Tax=Proteus mirabilis TaxID=584 RepID=UPI0023F6DA53
AILSNYHYTLINILLVCPCTHAGLFLFFWNAFIQLFTELSWVIETLCCHDISPLKSPAIERGIQC